MRSGARGDRAVFAHAIGRRLRQGRVLHRTGFTSGVFLFGGGQRAVGFAHVLFFFAVWAALYVAFGYASEMQAVERRANHFRLEAKNAQLRALHYQVNPHFLFNTLNSLSALVMRGSKSEAETMIMNLSSFLRSSLAIDPEQLVKVKHKRTADCVVIGYRVHKSGRGVGSLLLGLYGDDGDIAMVGGSSAFSDAKRLELQDLLEPMRLDPGQPRPGEPTRWRQAGTGEFYPVRPDLVAEFAYDQMENGRFRHTVKFLRWRPDREPQSCRYGQLEVPLGYDLYSVLEEL